MSAHLQITEPSFTLGGRVFKYIGKSAISITSAGGIRADLIAGRNGSISKISNIDEEWELTLPILVGSEDDSYLQDMFNSRTAYEMTGSVTQKIMSADGNDKLMTFDIYNFVIQNSPDGNVSFGVDDIENEAYAMYKIKFVGKRVV